MPAQDWYDGALRNGATSPLSLLILQPTPFCNIACRYCYLPDTANRSRMSMAVLSAVFRRLAEGGLDAGKITVLWHLGEPLVPGAAYYEHAFEVIERIRSPHLELCHSFQTNGTLIDDGFLQLIKKWAVRIGISLDGPAFIHDANRVRRNGRGTHAEVMAGVRRLQGSSVPLTAISVVSDLTLDHGKDLVEFFASIGINDLGFNVEEIEGAHANTTLQVTSERLERFKRFASDVYDAAVARSVRIREFDQLRRPLLNAGSIYSTLQNPFSVISVNWKGDFSTFSPELLADTEGRFVLGNVLTDSFSGAASSERYREMRAEIEAGKSACKASCSYYEICGGGCPSNKFFEHGTFRATETTQCRYIRKVMTDVLLERVEEEFGLASRPTERSLPSGEAHISTVF